jgi:uncharacterized protein (UPF0335 family)
MDERSYSDAVALLATDGKASTSYIQRKLQLNYNSAAAIVERMQAEGLVSAPDHRGVRTIMEPTATGNLTHDRQNSTEGQPVAKSGFAKEHLKSFIDRIERLEEERNALTADIREVYSELKGSGFDSKIVRQVVRLRKLDKADFQEQEAILDLYLTALDMR